MQAGRRSVRKQEGELESKRKKKERKKTEKRKKGGRRNPLRLSHFRELMVHLLALFFLPLVCSYPRSYLRRARLEPLRSTTEGSARLERARELLEEYSSSSPPTQFLLPPAIKDGPSPPKPPPTPPQVPPTATIPQPPPLPVLDATPEPASSIDITTRWSNGVKVASPLTRYNPTSSSTTYFKKPVKWITRNFQIAVPIGFWVVNVLGDVVLKREEANRKARAEQLLSALNGLGPAIIKGGQALASRPDLLPKIYLDELQKLQDDVPRFPDEVAFQTVEDELGVSFDSLFQLQTDGPIAAASIGQVYKATLRRTGETVAIKVQRPNCEPTIALDLYILRWWAGVTNILTQSVLQRDVDVQSIIDDFGELIYREIDYVAEAANAQRFAEIYASLGGAIFVPKVYADLTTSKVLVMEWVDGIRLTDSAGLAKQSLDKKNLVDSLVQCTLRQVLENGFFHADPHAGNMLATPDGRLCYLDFGMMGYAASEQRNGFLLAVVHMVNRDWSALVSLYQRLGFIPKSSDLSVIEEALENAMPDVLNADVSELNFKNVINQLGDVMYTYPFSLPPFYISIIRCFGVLEGLAIQVDDQFKIINDAYPYVASRLLTDREPDIQEALRRLAFTADGKLRWDRLESLLDEASGNSGYDVVVALELLSDYLLSDEGESVMIGLADEVVELVDALGVDTVNYATSILKALTGGDERSLVNALRALQIQLASMSGSNEIADLIPEPPETITRATKVLTLLSGNISSDEDGMQAVSKYLPFLQKMVNDSKVQGVLREIGSKLGERAVARSVKLVFGIDPNNGTTRRDQSV